MKRSLTYLFSALLALGCNGIHELPDENPVDPTLVQANLTLTIDPEELFPVAPEMFADDTECDLRWIVEIHRDEFGEPRTERFVSTCQPSSQDAQTMTIQVPLHAAKYKIAAWVDFVNAGTTCDKYYLTNTLDAIRITTPYQGNCKDKATFSSSCSLDLSAYRDQWNTQVECPLTLRSPMARIELVAIDFDKFIKQEALRTARDLSDLTVSITYAGYFPSGFNAFTDKANDAVTNIGFDSHPTLLSDQMVLLAYDYVFVNGEASNITVDITISDRQGQAINRIEGLRIPVERGKPATIKGEFLTQDFSPGIGIDPGFDGDIDVTIPD